jgi:hypothetical protein
LLMKFEGWTGNDTREPRARQGDSAGAATHGVQQGVSGTETLCDESTSPLPLQVGHLLPSLQMPRPRQFGHFLDFETRAIRHWMPNFSYTGFAPVP